MKDALIVTALSVVPKNLVARLMGHGTRLRLPSFLHKALVGWFVRKYGVNLDECEGGIDDFPTLAQFFVRPLKAGVRPVEADPDLLVSPVDAVAHTVGTIHKGNFLQYDGKPSSVPALLGGGDPRLPDLHPDIAARYEGGSFAVLYLSPKDYHRVHSPEAGRITTIRYLPGMLWPVFPAATRKIDNLFARNERLVFELETERFGTIAEVMVGAFGVGRMSTLLDPIITNTGGGEVTLKPQATVERAGEIGRFEMGSTVILCLEPGTVEWTIKPGQPVRLGRPIARRRVAG